MITAYGRFSGPIRYIYTRLLVTVRGRFYPIMSCAPETLSKVMQSYARKAFRLEREIPIASLYPSSVRLPVLAAKAHPEDLVMALRVSTVTCSPGSLCRNLSSIWYSAEAPDVVIQRQSDLA